MVKDIYLGKWPLNPQKNERKFTAEVILFSVVVPCTLMVLSFVFTVEKCKFKHTITTCVIYPSGGGEHKHKKKKNSKHCNLTIRADREAQI